MAEQTGVEWCDSTWTLIQGCDYESPGCVHCYAVPLIWRMAHNPNPKISAPLQGLVEKRGDNLVWTGKLALREDRLTWPLEWDGALKIFLPSHGDPFHKDVPFEFLDKAFGVMSLCPQHIFQVLSKRPERMAEYLLQPRGGREIAERLAALYIDRLDIAERWPLTAERAIAASHWPMPNVWAGCSVEDQKRADERREPMRRLAEAGWLTWVSYEPALEVIDWSGWEFLRWMVSGGESGPKARLHHPDCHRTARDFCGAHGIAYYFKQWGEFMPDGPDAVYSPNLYEVQRDGRVECTDFANPTGALMVRAGKKAAGRLLDGVEHSAYPVSLL